MASGAGPSREDPMAVVNRAVGQFESGGGGGEAFIPANSFQGPRPGYFFSRSSQGVGYYLDAAVEGGAPVASADASALKAEGQGLKKAAAAAQQPRSGEDLLAEAEEAAGGGQVQLLDAKTLKKLVTTLQRKFTHNVEQRAKHAASPQKFLESEIELDEAVRSLTTAAASPELYPDIIAAGAVPTLVSLLYHENGDIAAAAIELLSELTDEDAVEDSEEEGRALVEALMEGGLLEALVQRIKGLDERVPEEAAAVYNALAVVENAVELRPETAAAAAAQPGLLEWILQRVKPKSEVDGNKQYAAEVLAVVLQAGGDAARKRFVECDGVECMLRAVAPYKSRDPMGTEEEELVENAFDVLCTAMMDPAAKSAFVAAAGAELMVLILKGRTGARGGALKCLDFATTRCSAACDQVVDFGGLGTVFALFMGKLKAKGKRQKRDETAAAEEEERCISLVANLLGGVKGEARRARVAAKFAENEFEKCDRLMEVYWNYEERVAAQEARWRQEAGGEEDEDEEELLLARLDAGIFTLQQAAMVVGELWAVGDVGVRRRLLGLLHQRGRPLAALRGVLLERRATLMDGGAGHSEAEVEEGTKQAERVTRLLVALGHKEEEGEGGEEAIKGGDEGEEGRKRQRSDAADEGEGGGGEGKKRRTEEA